jgi:hypothetical protein
MMRRKILKRPAHSGYGKIVVARANPSRGKGFEIAHFVIQGLKIKSISKRDVFLPTLTKAVQWVLGHYPSARMTVARNDHSGRLCALAFRCRLSDFEGLKQGAA